MNKRLILNISGIAIGAFAVSILSDYVANEIINNDGKLNKKTLSLSLIVILASSIILYQTNKDKLKEL